MSRARAACCIAAAAVAATAAVARGSDGSPGGIRTETVATRSACTAGRPPGAYGWPVRPFDAQHPVRGNFGDPRIINGGGLLAESTSITGTYDFHNGVDISAPDGSPVYPVFDRVDRRAVGSGDVDPVVKVVRPGDRRALGQQAAAVDDARIAEVAAHRVLCVERAYRPAVGTGRPARGAGGPCRDRLRADAAGRSVRPTRDRRRRRDGRRGDATGRAGSRHGPNVDARSARGAHGNDSPTNA